MTSPRTGPLRCYRTIVVDPPWPQKAGGPLKGGHGEGFVGTTHSQPMPYPTLAIPQIAALRVDKLASPDGCHLYLWATNRFLPEAFSIVRAWKFQYSTTLVWAKAPIGAGLGGCYGISTEYVVYARCGRLREKQRIGTTWFNWKRPYNSAGKPMHSAKPLDFYKMVETVNHPARLEMFARQGRPDWDVWGDQAPDAIHLPVLGGAA